MKAGPQIVLAIGVGYLLGRSRKGRLALMIALAGATGRFGGPGQLVQQGVKRLAGSAELGKITESVRGELLDSAKSAAMSAASRGVRSLNGRLSDQLGEPTKRRRDEDDEADEEPEDYDGEDLDETEDEEPDEEPDEARDEAPDEDEEPEEPEEPPARPARRTRSSSASGRRSSGGDDKPVVRRTRR